MTRNNEFSGAGGIYRDSVVPLREKPIGILSHGQLAMMTGEAAKAMGIRTMALGPKRNEPSPASHVMPVVLDNYNDTNAVIDFSKLVKSLILDTDHVNTEPLFRLHAEGFPVIPNPTAILTVQNRIRQKEALNRVGIPIADWAPVRKYDDLIYALRNLGGDGIIKSAEGGFDGRLNMNLTSEGQADDYWGKNVVDAHDEKPEFVLEKRENLAAEYASIFATDMHGNRMVFPVVESFHERGMLEYTYFPSLAGRETEEKIVQIGQEVLDMIGGPVLTGVEFLFTTEGRLLLNEYALRPHNTGHWTIEGTTMSQFAALAIIASGGSLTETHVTIPGMTYMMRNLNGGIQFEKVSEKDYEIAANNGLVLHDYHKSAAERRKRAHTLAMGKNRQDVTDRNNKFIDEIGFRD